MAANGTATYERLELAAEGYHARAMDRLGLGPQGTARMHAVEYMLASLRQDMILGELRAIREALEVQS